MDDALSRRAAGPLLPILAILALCSPARGEDPPAALVQLWQNANSDCRGYPGDSPRSVRGCADREVYGRKLAAVGWCYGRRGEAGFQMQWHRCGPYSIRPRAE